MLFAKKEDGSRRLCVDWRALNEVTISNSWPLPKLNDLLDNLSGPEIFSSMHLTSACMQIRVREEVDHTAFKTPLGDESSPIWADPCTRVLLTGIVPHIRSWYCWEVCIIWMILMLSTTPEEQLRHNVTKFLKLTTYVMWSKFEWNKPEVHCLGHIVSSRSASGINMDPRKTEVDG